MRQVQRMLRVDLLHYRRALAALAGSFAASFFLTENRDDGRLMADHSLALNVVVSR